MLVNFWNGQTKKVPAEAAVKIPPPLSERIILELQMPLSARQMLVEQSPDYPSVVPPGYRASGPCRQNHFGHVCRPGTPKYVDSRCISPFCHFWLPAWEPVRSPGCTIRSEGALIPGTSLTKEELSRKVEEQLSKGRPSVSTSSESEKEENWKPKTDENVADLKSCEVRESNMTKPNKVQHHAEHVSVKIVYTTRRISLSVIPLSLVQTAKWLEHNFRILPDTVKESENSVIRPVCSAQVSNLCFHCTKLKDMAQGVV